MSDLPSPSTGRITSSNSETSSVARVAQSNADQVGALVQEVCVGLEGSLAVELRYQCKVHRDVGPSALACKPPEVLQGQSAQAGLFQDARRGRYLAQSSLPLRGQMGKVWARIGHMKNTIGSGVARQICL